MVAALLSLLGQYVPGIIQETVAEIAAGNGSGVKGMLTDATHFPEIPQIVRRAALELYPPTTCRADLIEVEAIPVTHGRHQTV